VRRGRGIIRPYNCKAGACVRPREAGVTLTLARPHVQVYFHLPLSIAPFV
jgi:hypothetical protein